MNVFKGWSVLEKEEQSVGRRGHSLCHWTAWICESMPTSKRNGSPIGMTGSSGVSQSKDSAEVKPSLSTKRGISSSLISCFHFDKLKKKCYPNLQAIGTFTSQRAEKMYCCTVFQGTALRALRASLHITTRFFFPAVKSKFICQHSHFQAATCQEAKLAIAP